MTRHFPDLRRKNLLCVLNVYASLFFASVVSSTKSVYPCHPPMEQLLVGNQDISSSPIFNLANNWADAFLTNLSAQISTDSLSLSVFGPSGDPIYQNYFGPLKGNDTDDYGHVGRNSIYRVASLTKVFTVLELLTLRDRGLIDFDKDITVYIPNFQYPTHTWRERLGLKQQPYNPETSLNSDSAASKDKITTRQLVTHLSGILRDVVVNQKMPLETGQKSTDSIFFIPRSSDDVFNTLNDYPTAVTPGSFPLYSNLAFILGQYIIEGAYNGNTNSRRTSSSARSRRSSSRGLTYAQIIKKDILDPLGMTSSYFTIPDHRLDDLVVPAEPFANSADRDLTVSNGAFGLSTTALDLRRFAQAILSNYYGIGKGSSFPIESSTIRDWIRPISVFDDNLTGIGAPWEIYFYPSTTQSDLKYTTPRGMKVYTKEGSLPGYTTHLVLDPSRQLGAVFLTTGNITDTTYIMEQITTTFGGAFDEYRKSVLDRKAGRFCLLQNNGGLPTDEVMIEVEQDTYYITKWVYQNTDMIKDALHLNELIGNDLPAVLPLWPTTEKDLYLSGTGSPPIGHFEGCMIQFQKMNSVFSNDYPSELVLLEEDDLYFPSGGQRYSKSACSK